jgi:hypothetical protein
MNLIPEVFDISKKIVLLCLENRGVAQSVARYVRDVEVAGSNLVTPTHTLSATLSLNEDIK